MKDEQVFEGFDGLLEIIKKLRAPGGCPWDREQSVESIKPYIIEEAYEVIEAIDSGDIREIKEELGDLLLQVVFVSQMASEAGDFKIDDVIEAISEKLVRRHPHVFGDEIKKTSAEVLKNWESIKIEERKKKASTSILGGVPVQMPALLRAHRITEKASRVGFDWTNIKDVFDKLEEELKEFEEAVVEKDPVKMEDELGDVFFALVNVGRFLEVNPEEALKKTISRFTSRFNYIEEGLCKREVDIRDAGLEEMEKLWIEAKEVERKKAIENQ